ncbi:hypothetical protein ACH4UM_17380 [Streptomyces sp. NPDC020801]|uniref:hypothetical protein n=1 Tax=unclassified Streptomyces TaxID=2593676 RepID=UPI0037AF49D2
MLEKRHIGTRALGTRNNDEQKGGRPMRRTTLHRTTVAAAAAATVLLVGCGAQGDGRSSASGGAVSPSATTSPGSPSPSASGSASPSASGSVPPSASPSAPPSHPAPAGCADHAELTAGDSGRTLCLRAGGQVRITLDGTKDRAWTPVKATGTALKAANPGFVIQPGDAVAAFDAVAPGTSRLTSSRPLCATRPGQVSCKGIQEWTVTVTVTKP